MYGVHVVHVARVQCCVAAGCSTGCSGDTSEGETGHAANLLRPRAVRSFAVPCRAQPHVVCCTCIYMYMYAKAGHTVSYSSIVFCLVVSSDEGFLGFFLLFSIC